MSSTDGATADALLVLTLEAAQLRNLPRYRRHGFEVLRALPPPAPRGPVVWTMLRRPAAQRVETR